jgi:hypothetical protein
MAIDPEHSLPFGWYQPSLLPSCLIAIGRRLPRNWAGRPIASLIRSLLKRYSGRPIDVGNLVPYLSEAPPTLLARFRIIEFNRSVWKEDLLGLLARIGFVTLATPNANLVLSLQREQSAREALDGQ